MADPHIAATPRIKSSTLKKYLRNVVEPDTLAVAKYFSRSLKAFRARLKQAAQT